MQAFNSVDFQRLDDQLSNKYALKGWSQVVFQKLNWRSYVQLTNEKLHARENQKGHYKSCGDANAARRLPQYL